MRSRRPAAVLGLLLLSLVGRAVGAPTLPEVHLPSKNFVNNGGFERGTEGWRYFSQTYGAVVTDEHHQGQSCFKATGMGEDYRYFQQENVPLTPGQTYTLSAWMKCVGFKRAGDNTSFLNAINWGWTKGAQIGPAKPDEDWTRYSVIFVAPPTKTLGEQPFYNLVLFWPIKSEGTIWVDDIQIEEGSSATDFSDQYLGWALEAQAKLRKAASLAQATHDTLAANFSELELAKSVDAQAAEIVTQAEGLVQRLNGFASLGVAAARILPDEAERLRQRAEGLKYVYYLGNPYLPLSEEVPPVTPPQELQVNWTCLSGEKRAVAVNVVNFTGHATTGRLAPGEVYDLTRQVRCPGVSWVTAYSAPPIRGFASPERVFTDPLPQVDEAGCFPIGDGRVSQVVLVVDTAALLPGDYQGEVALLSLTEAAEKRVVKFKLTVVPVRLPPLAGVEICDIGDVVAYARDSISPLGINTFFVQGQWLLPEHDPSGKFAMHVDFSRASAVVRERLSACPQARFVLGFGMGALLTSYLQRAYEIKPTDPQFKTCVTRWVQEVLKGFAALGVGPERVIFETVDEPGAGQLPLAAQWSELIRAAEPKARSMSYLTSLDFKDPACVSLYKALDIVAPGVAQLNSESVASLRQMGKTIWTYDCQNSGETFHPIAYYRLLPWLGWRYQLGGWGHFEWLAADRGRRYRAWEGVAEEAVVYPALDGGQVVSRRWLTLAAGVQDYRVLQALTRLTTLARRGMPNASSAVRAEKLLAEMPERALALRDTGSDYFLSLKPNAEPALLDQFREEAAGVVREWATANTPAASGLRVAVVASTGKQVVRLVLPRAGQVTVRYLCNHELPWHVASAAAPPGAQELSLPCQPGQIVTRCIVEFADESGLVQVASAKPLLTVTVDSSAEGYVSAQLNDGLATPGMKFEPDRGWISEGTATEHWVVATLDKPRPISQLRVWWMTFGGLPQAYKLQVWTQNQWQDAPGFADWHAAQAPVETLRWPTCTTDRMRLLQRGGGGGHGVPNMMGLSEVEME